MRIVSALLVVAACLVSTSAFALQQETEPPSQFIEFGPEVIEGGVLAPEGEMTVVRGERSFHSLLAVRTSFIDEVVKSAEEVSLR